MMAQAPAASISVRGRLRRLRGSVRAGLLEKPMDMQACTDALRAKVGESSGLEATLKFDCGADGVAYVDGRSAPNRVDNVDRDADCTLAIALQDLAALLRGELDPAAGFMMGRFKVSGDMRVAMKLQRVV
jgi:putative sterol carrier protein